MNFSFVKLNYFDVTIKTVQISELSKSLLNINSIKKKIKRNQCNSNENIDYSNSWMRPRTNRDNE